MAEWFAMVHLPIPMKKAQSMPRARDAVQKEWDALASLPAWDISKVIPKAQVIAEYDKAGKSVHFGSLLDLCHKKEQNSIVLLTKRFTKVVLFFEATKFEMKQVFMLFLPNNQPVLLTWLLSNLWTLLAVFLVMIVRTQMLLRRILK